MVVALLVLVVTAWLIFISHLIRLVLLFLLGFILFTLLVLDFLFNFLILLIATYYFYLLSDILIVIDRHNDLITFFLALDLNFGEDKWMVDCNFMLCFENNLSWVMRGLIDDFGWMIIKFTVFALYIIGE